MEPEGTSIPLQERSRFRSVQPIPPNPLFLRFNLILFTDLRLPHPSGRFCSGFRISILYALLFLIRATCATKLIFLDFVILIILARNKSYEGPQYAALSHLLSKCSPQRPVLKCSPQRPVLKHTLSSPLTIRDQISDK
jgi:hypothetical protein